MMENIKGECGEPGCRYPAVKEWRGMKLCQDCWEKYKRKEEDSLRDLQGW
ncbi:hypothetical protein JW898_01510 [Candidatus Woesearchaeota archaeon]|nr:hypothetical protein [Candidatus Woesearchaeota archaeon]